jgi:hypothetical protein
MFDFDEAIKIALKTWYPEDHSLHLDQHHPSMKLVGEFGEYLMGLVGTLAIVLDNYAKLIYKPEYEFNPLDELGDIWYYLRILCYQRDYVPNLFHMPTNDIDFLIATAIFHSSEALCSYFRGNSLSPFYLDVCYTVVCKVCEHYDITLQQLTDSNWQKLKPGSERGEQWAKGRVETGYIGGKICKK